MAEKNESTFISRFISVLLTIITFVVTGILGFLWNLNREFAVLKEKDIEKQDQIDKIQLSINHVRENQEVLNGNSIRLSTQLENIQVMLDVNKKH